MVFTAVCYCIKSHSGDVHTNIKLNVFLIVLFLYDTAANWTFKELTHIIIHLPLIATI